MAEGFDPGNTPEFEVQADKIISSAEKLIASLNANEAESAALQDELVRKRLQAAAAAVDPAAVGSEQAPQVEKLAAAQQRLNTLKQEGVALGKAQVEIDVQQLDLVARQAEIQRLLAARERTALEASTRQRLQAAGLAPRSTPGEIIVPGAPAPGQLQAPPGGVVQIAGYASSERILAEHQARLLEAEIPLRERLIAEQHQQVTLAERQLQLTVAEADALAKARAGAFSIGGRVAVAGGTLSGASGRDLSAGFEGEQAALIELSAVQGQYAAFAERSGTATAEMSARLRFAAIAAQEETLSTEKLSVSLLRLGLADAEASNQLRAHGALTTEFLGALARGETTVAEFGYQIGATIGKFAGWTAAAAATYGALGVVYEFGKGAVDAASGVQQLTRTIDGLDREKASTALQDLSAQTNVPIKEASDAVFAFSRTFHTLDGAVTGAKLALQAFKLDGVSVTDTVKAATAISQQYGLSAQQLVPVFDQLAQGQQIFNARISDQIPLLQRSAGAIKNAGGSLNEYIQLTTYALRTTQLSGSQLGTYFQRAASNYLNPGTAKGQTDITTLQNLGVKVDPTDVVKTLLDAIRRAADLTPSQRRDLSIAVGGPGYGGRGAAIFGGSASDIALQQKIGIKEAPGAAQGVLQREFDRQVHTAGEEFKSFKVELQDLGAALAGTGIITVFTTLVSVVHGMIDDVRKVVDVFDALPGPVKDVAEAVVGLRLAMLLVSRTRLGQTIPGLNQLPGFRPSEATQTRAALAIGNRAVVNSLGDEIAKSSQGALSAQREALILEQERVAVNREIEDVIAAGGKVTQAQLQQQVSLSAQIEAANVKAAEYQSRTINAQKAQRDAADLQVRLTATNRTLRAPDSEVRALGAETAALTVGAEADAAATQRSVQAQYLTQRAAAVKGRLARAVGLTAQATKLEAIAAGEVNVAAAEAIVAERQLSFDLAAEKAVLAGSTEAEAQLAFAFEAEAAAAAEVALAGEATGAAAITAGAALRGAAVSAGALVTRLGGLAAAVDPLLVVLVALPFVAGALASDSRKFAETTASVKAILAQTPTEAGGAKLASLLDNGQIFALKQYQQQILQYMLALHRQEQAFIRAGGLGTELTKGLQHSAQVVGDATRTLAVSSGSSLFAAIAQLGPKAIEQQIQRLDDQAKILGASNDSAALKRAAYEYQYLATKYSTSSKTADLQAIQTAESNYLDVVTKGVQDLLKAAANASTSSGESRDLSQASALIAARLRTNQAALAATIKRDTVSTTAIARAVIESALGNEGALVALAQEEKASAASIARAKQAADQVASQLHDLLAGPLDAALGQIGTQTALAQSRVSGNSPEAAITQAQIALAGLRKELALAEQNHASYEKIAGLETQINNAANALSQQQVANSDAIASAQGSLAVAAITGSGPGPDLARAQQTLLNAQGTLARDSAEGKGAAQTLQDQAAIDQAANALGQQAQSNADAILSAQGALALSSITGTGPATDIARAKQVLANAQALLAHDQAEGKGLAQSLQDQAAVNDAANALQQTLQSADQTLHQQIAAYIQSKAGLAESRTVDPVKQAQEQLKADIKVLGTILRKDYSSQQAYLTALNEQKKTINQDRLAKVNAIASQDQSTLQFELHIGKITDAQYVSGLQKLLDLKKLTLSQRQQILTEIFDTTQAAAVNLNTGSIKLPTTYEVKRGIEAAAGRARAGYQDQVTQLRKGQEATFATVNRPPGVQTTYNRVTISIVNHKDVDLHKMAHTLQQALDTNFIGAAQAAGLYA